MARYSWRKMPTRDGMMRLAPSYGLFYGGKRLATVALDAGGAWYWYGGGRNARQERSTDLDAVKRAAKAFIVGQSVQPDRAE